MTSAANPYEAMMAQMQEMAKAMAPALESFAPKGFDAAWPTMPREMMEMAFGKGANPEGLDARTRLMLTLAGLTCQGAQNDVALRQTVRHLAEAGASRQEIVEAIGLMGMFAGLPAMNRAMTLAQDALEPEEDKG